LAETYTVHCVYKLISNYLREFVGTIIVYMKKTRSVVLIGQHTFITGGMDSDFCKRLCMKKEMYTS
jgi:hypothetical protein